MGPSVLRRQLRHLGPDGLTHLLDALGPTAATKLLAGRPKPAALDALRKGLRAQATRDTLKALVPETTLLRLLTRGADPELLATTVTRFEALKVNTSPTADLLVYLENLEPHRLNDELHHAAEAARLEALDESHVIRRHGPQIPDGALEQRLKDGSLRYEDGGFETKHSTRFESYRSITESRERAFVALGEAYHLDPLKPPGPSWTQQLELDRAAAANSGNTTFEMVLGKSLVDQKAPIGDGVALSTGALSPLKDLTRTSSKVVWRAKVSDPWTGRWVLVQHHPVN